LDTKTSTTRDTYVHLFEAQRHAQDARAKLDADFGVYTWPLRDDLCSCNVEYGVVHVGSGGR